jgi:hypothetical protein
MPLDGVPFAHLHHHRSVHFASQAVRRADLARVRAMDTVSLTPPLIPAAPSNPASGGGLMIRFGRTTSPAVIAVTVGIAGIGIGSTFQPTMIACQAHCTKSQRAVVISDRNFFRCLGGACGLAVSAAVLQAVLRSHLPEGYKSLAHSTYSLPSRENISDAEWSTIIDAYTAASQAVFILQVPLIGACFLLCVFVRDRGLERPKDPNEEGPNEQRQPAGNQTPNEHHQQPEAVREKPTNHSSVV